MNSGKYSGSDDHGNIVIIEGIIEDEPVITVEQIQWSGRTQLGFQIEYSFRVKNVPSVAGHLRQSDSALVPVLFQMRTGKLNEEELFHSGMNVVVVGRLRTIKNTTQIFTETIYKPLVIGGKINFSCIPKLNPTIENSKTKALSDLLLYTKELRDLIMTSW